MADIGLILVAEDCENDAFLIERAFAQARLGHSLRFVSDGEELLDYLAGAGSYADRQAHPVPSLILLDTHMPKINGFEALRWIRAHPDFRNVPVIMLTSSDYVADLENAYALGANGFAPKSPDFRNVALALHSTVAGVRSR